MRRTTGMRAEIEGLRRELVVLRAEIEAARLAGAPVTSTIRSLVAKIERKIARGDRVMRLVEGRSGHAAAPKRRRS